MNLILQKIELPPIVEMDAAAKEGRDALILQSKQTCVGPIKSEDDASKVGLTAREIRTQVKMVRDAGAALRKPLEALKKRISAIEDDYCVALETEQKRLESVATEWRIQEEKRVVEEQRAREAEIQRLEQARIDAERKAESERQRIAKEAAEAEARAKEQESKIETPEQLEAAVRAEEARREAAQQAEMDAFANSERARMEAEAAKRAAIIRPLPVASKPAGMSTRTQPKFEVTNEAQLLKTHRHLFKVELSLSAAKSTCFPKKDSTKENPDLSIDGLKMWNEMDTSTRSY